MWDGTDPLGPFLESCDEFLEGYEDGEKLEYLISRCSGSPQLHLRNERDLNRQAGNGYSYKDGHESLLSVLHTGSAVKYQGHQPFVPILVRVPIASLAIPVPHMCLIHR